MLTSNKNQCFCFKIVSNLKKNYDLEVKTFFFENIFFEVGTTAEVIHKMKKQVYVFDLNLT
jgi:hypothetical protein